MGKVDWGIRKIGLAHGRCKPHGIYADLVCATRQPFSYRLRAKCLQTINQSMTGHIYCMSVHVSYSPLVSVITATLKTFYNKVNNVIYENIVEMYQITIFRLTIN